MSPTRIGNMADNLSQIKTLTRKALSLTTVEYLSQESKYFIEWAAIEVDIDTSVELLELQRQLSHWQFHWSTIWQNPEEREKVAARSQLWAERILELLGLL
ncbi:hypothetical protein [Pseudanabaena sp. PCC 6802]|uniref:hypothetical protein n=1 Tax=Pseudanabaena sp. PCC 6802 TaxID=118173 RepID=UPI0012EA1F25|nr:hypothetical protein [Pseudanabaena sp. PCC 6802]